jgi:hypothetical protein
MRIEKIKYCWLTPVLTFDRSQKMWASGVLTFTENENDRGNDFSRAKLMTGIESRRKLATSYDYDWPDE